MASARNAEGREGGAARFSPHPASLLDETRAPLNVQQELMRRADIRTTMNAYGKAMEKSKREALGKAARLVLAPLLPLRVLIAMNRKKFW